MMMRISRIETREVMSGMMIKVAVALIREITRVMMGAMTEVMLVELAWYRVVER